MKLLCTGIHVKCGVDDVPRITADFIIPVHPTNTEELGKLVGKSVTLLADGVDIVKTSKYGHPRCFHCAQLNAAGALECRQCGAPI